MRSERCLNSEKSLLPATDRSEASSVTAELSVTLIIKFFNKY